ncbi:MAG: GxxExxY protein [Candidatus Cloacimonadales bacterium]|nr:GxxExxY protein [Candidatus Cloacimonadales bacterium]
MKLSELNKISKIVLDAAIEVHRQLGPGLLESVYEKCLSKELSFREIENQMQVSFPLFYKQASLDASFRIDMIVAKELFVEIKAVEQVLPVHRAQLLSYLRLANKRLGILINFNVPKLIEGWERIINGYDE